MKCWRIHYYFRVGSARKLYKGEFCGCISGATKEDAIASVSPIEMDDGRTLVKVTATPAKTGHSCFSKDAIEVQP